MYSLILVDYNSIDKTIEYVKACKDGLGLAGASHVVIVENGAADGVLDRLGQTFGAYDPCSADGIEQALYHFSAEHQQVYLCFSGENLGYARGNNLGIHIAAQLWNDPYYIVSNNDLVFPSPLDLTAIDAAFDENPTVGAIGPTVITPAGESQSPRHWQSATRQLVGNYLLSAFGGLLGNTRRERLWKKYADDTVIDAQTGVCDWISGCFMFLRAEAFMKAGMFDEHTFLYAEEMILSRRLENVGYHMYFLKELSIVHNHAQTTRSAISQLRMAEIDFEAKLYYYKAYRSASLMIILLAKFSFWLFTLGVKMKNALHGGKGNAS